jgi:transposase
MNELIGAHDPHQVIHVILDNLSTHKPKHDRWLARHPNVHFYFTPTRASWLNQVECWFSILGRQALQGASFPPPSSSARPWTAASKATTLGPCHLNGRRRKCIRSIQNDITLIYVTKY